MEKLITGMGIALLAFLLITFAAVLYGTVLWAVYPHIHSLFPTALEKGILAKDLGWWDSVCISWIFSILIKSSNTNNSSKS